VQIFCQYECKGTIINDFIPGYQSQYKEQRLPNSLPKLNIEKIFKICLILVQTKKKAMITHRLSYISFIKN